MKSTDALGDLLQLKRPLIETREAAVRLGISLSRASHLLAGLDRAGLVARIRPGLWTLETEIDPLRVPPYLTAPYPAYISFWSALVRHGMIEQVPGARMLTILPETEHTAGVFEV